MIFYSHIRFTQFGALRFRAGLLQLQHFASEHDDVDHWVDVAHSFLRTGTRECVSNLYAVVVFAGDNYTVNTERETNTS